VDYLYNNNDKKLINLFESFKKIDYTEQSLVYFLSLSFIVNRKCHKDANLYSRRGECNYE
ncbi:hypothetical protein, partial [Clostridioides difficile]|uniref:hypothetical protein n=1 Tax=Clostridioides difficile TaxID=1496 RepID=UPI001CA521B7